MLFDSSQKGKIAFIESAYKAILSSVAKSREMPE